jgi:membrane-associated phospholipid phosphatase
VVEISRKLLWWGLAFATATAWAACWYLGMAVGMTSGWIGLSMISLIALAVVRKPTWSPLLRRTLNLLELFFLLLMIGYCGALLSYVVMSCTSGYTDDLLVRMDASLGLDWLSIWRAADRHRWIMEAGRISYTSFFITPLILLPALVLTGRSSHAYAFMLAYALCVFLVDVVFAAFPARAAFQHFLSDRPEVWGHGPRDYLAAIEQLRAGTLRQIEVDRLSGIVTFPSFHAAAGILFIWAAWPLRPLRLPMLLVNSAMLASATFFGGHYVVDLFGGIALAYASVAAITALERRAARTPEADSSQLALNPNGRLRPA